MSVPLNSEEQIIAMYDSFAKTVMRNQCRNIVKSKRRKQNREILLTEDMQYLFANQSCADIYPSEQLHLEGSVGISAVCNEKLYYAILSLPKEQKDVLILDFWNCLSDRQIALRLGITVRSVYNRRKRAFDSIRNYYERMQDGEQKTYI